MDIFSELISGFKNVLILGVVIQFAQEIEVGSKGRILGVVVDKLKKIKVDIGETDRSLILKAYRERLPIILMGNLIKEGDRFILRNPEKFALDNI